jgi:hypothetical protein
MSEERKIELLEELVKWVKVTSIPKVKATLEELTQTPEERRVYGLSDGKRTTREIEKLTGVGRNIISRLWKKWTRAGIAEPITIAGGGIRAKSLFSFEDFGIEILKNTQMTQEMEDTKEEESTRQIEEVEK